jgi:hypothetical protein
MKMPERDGRRIGILFGLAATEVYFIYHFFQHRDLGFFLGASVSITLLIATFYWLGWFVRHGVNNFHVCMLIGLAAAAELMWRKGDRAACFELLGVMLIGVIILLRRIARAVDVSQQEKNVKAYQAEANSLDPVTRDALNLLFFIAFGVALLAQERFRIDNSDLVLLILPIWYVYKLIHRAFRSRRTGSDESVSGQSKTDLGGRA